MILAIVAIGLRVTFNALLSRNVEQIFHTAFHCVTNKSIKGSNLRRGKVKRTCQKGDQQLKD